MIKKLTGLTASLVALASTASAEVKINDYLSLDGYAIGALAVTEGTAAGNTTFVNSGDKMLDAAKVAVNGTYGDFTSKVSLLAVPQLAGSTGNSGLLDAYVTYTVGEFAITAGKFNSWLGYESFDSPNNAFMTFGPADNVGYVVGYGTGAKVEYITDTFSTGISARDSLAQDPGSFFSGDGEFGDDVGFEAYVLYTGVEKLTLFFGLGYEDTDGAVDALQTYNAWAAYDVTDKLTLVGSYASKDDGTAAGTVTFSYTVLATYAISDDLSVAGRFGLADGQAGDYSEVGIASTYTFTENFSVKGEVNKKDFNAQGDTLFYAVQGIFQF